MHIPHCFTCDSLRNLNGDGYLIERRDGSLVMIAICDPCRNRHARTGHIGASYLIEDRLAHGLPAAGVAYPA
jgi:hypothetical protein